MTRPSIGLALGSGAARGLAHIGVIRALAEAGIEPDIVCGSSIGAIVGASYAAGKTEALEDWVRTITWREIVNLLDVRFSNGGLIEGERLIRFLYPPDVKGTGFLVIEHSDRDDDMWLYLPTLRKSRRKLASSKKDSFLGTEFSYGDITGPSVSEYNYRMKEEKENEQTACHVIEAVPATEDILSDYGYSKRIDYV